MHGGVGSEQRGGPDALQPTAAAPARSLTRLVYPGAVPVQLPLDLLLAPQFHESPPVLHSLSLFGKLPVDKEDTVR